MIQKLEMSFDPTQKNNKYKGKGFFIAYFTLVD